MVSCITERRRANEKKLSKKSIIAISVSLAAVIILGVVVAVVASAGGEKADVVPVSQIMNSWAGNTMTTSGMVQSYMAQTITYNKADIITKMHVKEGDEVNIGDPLVEYDVTVLDLQQKLKN